MGYDDSPKCIYIAITPFVSPSEPIKDVLHKHNLSPRAIFEDLDKESTRKLIRSFLKSVTGVYIIVNKLNGKMYVGSAIQGQMYIRFYKHLISGKGGSKLVFAAVTKYGLNHFAFLVADTLNVNTENNQDLLAREDLYLSKLKPAYNVAKYA